MKFLFLSLAFLSSVVMAQDYRCVQNCLERDYRGKCMSYAAENYCGPDVKCVPHCVSRAFNEVCVGYTVDYCGSNATCKTTCSFSYNGVCEQYGADRCYTR